jgi:indoleacetamide hydrolase
MSKALLELTATQAVRAMTDGEIRAEAYAAALLARCRELKHLNAFISLHEVGLLEAARDADRRRASGAKLGPLHGLPLAIKDSVNTKDLRTTNATAALRHFRPEADAAVVATLYRAGALLLGKTNLHELSYGWTTAVSAFGPVKNPFDQTKVAGGSSGGTAVAVAAHMAPAGLAEDTNGSIRIPAAFCGIFGLRPSTLRWPQQGVMPLSPTYDTVGPHARSVADLALLDSVVTGAPPPIPSSLRRVRLGVPRAYFYAGLDAEVERVTESALRTLSAAGAELVERDIPELAELVEKANYPIIHHEVAASIERFLAEQASGTTLQDIIGLALPQVKLALEATALPGGPYRTPHSAYAAACEVHRPALQQAYRQYFTDHQLTAVVFPTSLCPPPPLGDESLVVINQRSIPLSTAVARNISPGSCAGLPGLVVPAGMTSKRLPIGIELDAPAGADTALLGLGLTIEQVLDPLPSPTI